MILKQEKGLDFETDAQGGGGIDSGLRLGGVGRVRRTQKVARPGGGLLEK